MVYIVSDKKSWARGVRTLVNNFGVNGDFNQRKPPVVGRGFATISWTTTLTNYFKIWKKESIFLL